MKEIISKISDNSAIIVGVFCLLAIMGIIVSLTLLSNKKLDISQPNNGQWQATTEASINYTDARLDAVEATQAQILDAFVHLETARVGPNSVELAELRSEIKANRAMIATLREDITFIKEVHGFYSANTDNKVAELALDIDELEEALTAHSGNTTIHEGE